MKVWRNDDFLIEFFPLFASNHWFFHFLYYSTFFAFKVLSKMDKWKLNFLEMINIWCEIMAQVNEDSGYLILVDCLLVRKE